MPISITIVIWILALCRCVNIPATSFGQQFLDELEKTCTDYGRKNPLRTTNLVSTRIPALYSSFFAHPVKNLAFYWKSIRTRKNTKRTKKTQKLFYSFHPGLLGWCVSACSGIKVSLVIKRYQRLRTKNNVSGEQDQNIQKFLSECKRSENKGCGSCRYAWGKFWDIDLGNYRIMKASVHSFATVFCGHHIVTP